MFVTLTAARFLFLLGAPLKPSVPGRNMLWSRPERPVPRETPKTGGSVTVRRTIALLSDFGTKDWYVAAMKGVIASINPEVLMVDITHEIRPHSIVEAALTLRSCYEHFPPGTVFLAVVDPGVGTERRAVAIEAGGRFFVGPDNGVFGPVLDASEGYTCVELFPAAVPVSPTFHGRDVFAPAAGRLTLGIPLERMGESIKDPVLLHLPEPKQADHRQLAGQVLYVDRFGNLITNIRSELVTSAKGNLAIASLSFPRIGVTVTRTCETYSGLAQREPGILVGSTGHVEVALCGASASEFLGVGPGEPLEFSVTAAVGRKGGRGGRAGSRHNAARKRRKTTRR